MKLTAVSNNQLKQKINYNNKKNNQTSTNKNINFKGAADFATVFWNFVDKGGRGLQFTVEDMFGTNFPRTYQGAMAGYEYTGKINVNYLKQEGIREFLTGPTMTIAPIAILAAATKLVGKTANIHRKNISNLSYLASTLGKEKIEVDTFKNSFITTVVKDMLEKTTEKKATEENINTLVNEIKNYSEQLTKAKTKADKKTAKETLSNLGAMFENIIKTTKNDFSNTSFQAAKHSISSEAVGSTNFKNYVNYITAYAEDYAKTNTKDGFVNLASDAIKKFENLNRGKRGFVIAAMILLTGYIMSYIPKLYTWASGGQNPAGEAIYAEAAKREGK